MRAFALIRMTDGVPDLDPEATPYHGFVLCDRIPGTNWGAYLISGTGAQLLALDALPQCLGILAFTRSDERHWGPDMDNILPSAVRNKINSWLTPNGQPAIPIGWTYRRFIQALFRRLNPNFRLDAFDIAEP